MSSSSSIPPVTPPTPPTPPARTPLAAPAGLEDSITGYYRLVQQSRELDGGKALRERNPRLLIPAGTVNAELDKLKTALTTSRPDEIKRFPDEKAAVAAIVDLQNYIGILKHNITGGHPAKPELDKYEEYYKKVDDALKDLITKNPPGNETVKKYLEQQQAALSKADEALKKDLEKLKEAADEKKQEVQSVMDFDADRSRDIAIKAKFLETKPGEKDALYTLWAPYRDYDKEEEVALFEMKAGDGKDSFDEALEKIRNSQATLYKSINSKYVISYDKENGVHPIGVELPSSNRGGFVEGWKQTTAFLALKDPDVQKYGLKISLKTPPVSTTADKKEFLLSILEIAKHAHDKEKGLGLKVVFDPNVRKALTEVLADKNSKLTSADRQAFAELDALDKQFVQRAGKDAEKKTAADTKKVGPWEVPKRLMLEDHAKNLKENKDLKAPATKKEQLDQLDVRYNALENAHQEVRRYLEAIKPPEKPNEVVTSRIEEVIVAMRAEEAGLSAKYRAARDEIKAMPDSSPDKAALLEQANKTFSKLSAFLTQNILPQEADFRQKVGTQDDLLKWHVKELQTPLPASPAQRDEMERAMVVSMNKIERAVDEIKKMEKATPQPDKAAIDTLKAEIKTQMGNLQSPLQEYLLATPKEDGTQAAQDANRKSNILREKYTKDLPAKLDEIGMTQGQAPKLGS